MRMMVVFEKGESLRYIGHLDLMRAMQRALRRSGLPIRYSNGFNPHIRLSFAAPLSVGIVGLRELMEVPLEDGVREEDFKAGMNAVLPASLRVRQCRALEDGFPALMSLVAGSRYLIRFPSIAESDRAAMHPNVRDHEPAVALFVPDDDPLCFYRAIARAGRRMLRPGGRLWFEIYEHAAEAMREMLAGEGYTDTIVYKDLFDKDRITCSRRK